MAQNYISEGDVITLTADKDYESGKPYRIHGFNGVALLTVSEGDLLSFQLEGVFEFELSYVDPGDIIYIYGDNTLHSVEVADEEPMSCHLFGRAVTGTDEHGNFNCRLLQST